MNNQVFYLSVLNVISALAVVFLHANGIFWAHPSGSTWISANIIESLCIFAVPIFYMLTGCTLVEYSKRYSTKTFFAKRLKKVVIPFLFWSLVAALYCYYTKPNMEWSADSLIRGILTNKFMGIYWFFMPLIAIYLAMPVLTNIQNKVKVFTYMAAYALITISLIGFVKPFGFDYFPPNLNTPISGGVLLFPLIGYILHHSEINRKWRISIYAAGIICMLCHCVFTIVLSPEGEPICKYFKGVTLLPNVIYAASVFVFFKYNAERLFSAKIMCQLIDFIKPTTFGVYLIHIYFHYTAREMDMDISTLSYRIIGALVIFTLCVLLVKLIQKSKIGRILVP